MSPSTRRNVLKTVGAGIAATGLFATSGAAKNDPLTQELNSVRAATRKYRDPSLLAGDGYIVGPIFVPNMGYHFINPGLFGTTDILEPTVIVYFANSSKENPEPSDYILGAVEYLYDGDVTDDPPNLFSDEDSSRNLKVSEEEGWHFVEDQEFSGLHAWVHRGNPAGVFHDTNPTV